MNTSTLDTKDQSKRTKRPRLPEIKAREALLHPKYESKFKGSYRDFRNEKYEESFHTLRHRRIRLNDLISYSANKEGHEHSLGASEKNSFHQIAASSSIVSKPNRANSNAMDRKFERKFERKLEQKLEQKLERKNESQNRPIRRMKSELTMNDNALSLNPITVPESAPLPSRTPKHKKSRGGFFYRGIFIFLSILLTASTAYMVFYRFMK